MANVSSSKLDTRAFLNALQDRTQGLSRDSERVEARMASDIASKARATVKRRTGETAEGIKSDGGTHTAPNPYLEFGTVHMAAQPFFRPARHEVEESFRGGHYKPKL